MRLQQAQRHAARFDIIEGRRRDDDADNQIPDTRGRFLSRATPQTPLSTHANEAS
ncbi:MAG TPA: hypothetical protein VN903_30440 [Polyangia bacterium]|jgi:hypothetical protein|nr:hypothetical protein [Polyangia bacterium]